MKKYKILKTIAILNICTLTMLSLQAQVTPLELGREYTNAKLAAIRDQLDTQLTNQNYESALQSISQIPKSNQTNQEKFIHEKLRIFKMVDVDVSKTSSILESGIELDNSTKRKITKLYKKAEEAILKKENMLAQDLLIHSIYIHRRYARAKKLLKYALHKNTGQYKIKNQQQHYWRLSNTYFYGGTFEKALDALKIYAILDENNPETFEKMGSNYYMIGENQQAIDAWNTALFLNPELIYLEAAIKTAKENIKEDKILAKKRKALQAKIRKEQPKTKDKNSKLIGVFPNQTQAYNYAQRAKKQGIQAFVEELATGKWAVKINQKKEKKE